MTIPPDYVERVYAGVLGKMIGVYLGRPIEGMTYQQISREFGEIDGYVHERRGVPLIVTDDDLSGTFTFVRAMADYGCPPDLSPAQIGQTWLNYIIENRTILWWGGMGNSTEHTAFLRLKNGIPAPRSGSMALNSPVVAEQIGAQIFIDGWAMLAPGDPALAASLARRAASGSHDGEALYAAQSLAAMEALAFVEPSIDRLLEAGTSFIARDSVISRLVADLRQWRRQDGDWRTTRRRLEERYGYEKYGGGCHVVPNHGLIILALLYCDDNFDTALKIVNTCGWDTDCNSGNLGCLLGIKNGLAGLEAGYDWRGPLADQVFLPTADGGSAISDALTIAYQVANSGRALTGLPPLAPKGGARFHFSLPGAVQTFRVETGSLGSLTLANASLDGERRLALRWQAGDTPLSAAAPTFIPLEFACQPQHYGLVASPTLYPGQVVRARLFASPQNSQPATAALFIRHYGPQDDVQRLSGLWASLRPGESQELAWPIPALDGQPVAEVGVEIRCPAAGELYLDYLTWDGEPDVRLGRPAAGGTMWLPAWVSSLDGCDPHPRRPYQLIQNHGEGLLMQGTRQWRNYAVSATLYPHLAAAAGVAARLQGLERYYALLAGADRKIRLVKALDGRKTLAETDLPFEWDAPLALRLAVDGPRLQAWANERLLFDLQDGERPLLEGGIALLVAEGRVLCDEVLVTPYHAGGAA